MTEYICEYVSFDYEWDAGYDMGYIRKAELIRCKDCVHFKQSKVLGNTCALTDNHVTKKDYCSKAERKEE